MSTGCCCFWCIETQEVAVVEKLGRYSQLARGGLNCICYPIQDIAGTVSLRVQQIIVGCETKTIDNVFVQTECAVQYQVIQTKVFDAFYLLQEPTEQLRSYVFDVIRSTIPLMTLDQVFETKDEVAHAVKDALEKSMGQYGYEILQVLLNDISPNDRVKNAMNEINASQRMKEAAEQKAEADKVLKVKAAEADAEAKYLSGVGVAKQRSALINGLRDSIVEFTGNVRDVAEKDIMDLLLLSQYFDCIRDIGDNKNTVLTFTAYASPTTADEDSMRNAIMQARR